MEFTFVVESDHWHDPHRDVAGQIEVTVELTLPSRANPNDEPFVEHFEARYAGNTYTLAELHPADAIKVMDQINDRKSQYRDYCLDMAEMAHEMSQEMSSDESPDEVG